MAKDFETLKGAILRISRKRSPKDVAGFGAVLGLLLFTCWLLDNEPLKTSLYLPPQ